MCTLGPSTDTPELIEQLAWAGMDAARLNFSHGDHETHMRSIQSVRRAQDLIGRPLAVIADLQGPKIRIGPMEAPITVQPGDTMMLAPAGAGRLGDFEITFPELPEVVSPGSEILINDGLVRIRVVDSAAGRVETRVEVGGVISSGKGVNLPGTHLPIPVAHPQGSR